MQIPLYFAFNSEVEKAWNDALPLIKLLIKEGTALRFSKNTANCVVVEFTANPECISFGEEK